MGRPTDWYVLDLDKDPTPGDPVQVESLAKRLRDFADDVGEALRSIKGLAGDSAVQQWTGLSGDEYRRQFDDTPKELTKLERSYRMCGNALAAYWPDLKQAQGDADRALEQGRQAKADLGAASASLTSASDWMSRANAASKKYQEDPAPDVPPPSDSEVRAAARNAADATTARNQAQGKVDAAQDRLDAAKRLAADARRLREDAADRAKNAIDDASDAGIQNKKWWQKAVDFVVDHWDEIVAVCKVVVAVLGVVVLIIGGPLAWVVFAAALVVLADTLIKYMQGKASLWDVAFAALDCIPGTKGLTTIGGLAAFAKGGLKSVGGIKAGLTNLARGVRYGGDEAASLRKAVDDPVPVSKPRKVRCEGGDPIDLVSGEMLLYATDVHLPGLLPLAVARTHLSSYRSGRWFGRSWASTVDERLEVDGEGVLFAVQDGTILVYPVPEPGVEVLPLEGPRWPLLRDGTADGAIEITDPHSGVTRYFTPVRRTSPAGTEHAPTTAPDGTEAPAAEPPAVWPLAALSDRNGHRVIVQRSLDGAPRALRHTGGYHLAVDTDGHRVTALRLLGTGEGPTGTTLLRYGYDAAGNLAEVVDGSGLAQRLDYDADGHIVRKTDRNGSWYAFAYDDQHRCVRGTGADDYLSCTLGYDPVNRVNTYTDSLGHTSHYHYDARGQVTRQTDPSGHTTASTWDRYDRLLSRTDPAGHTTRYDYDEHGNLTEVSHPDGTRNTAEYGPLHRPLRLTSPSGAQWRRSYDARGNLLSATGPDGATTSYRYDDRGGLAAITDALGRTTTFTSDARGLLATSSNPLGETSAVVRDAFGRPVSCVDPLGNTTRFTWTPQGRLVGRARPGQAEETWALDAEGNVVAHTTPDGRTTRFEVTHFGVTTARTEEGLRYTFAYDTELRLTRVTNPIDETWEYTYDPAGRLVRETDVNGRRIGYRYDAAGRLVERVNGAGQGVVFEHDARGRIVRKQSPDAVTAFGYDPDGLLVAASNPAAEVTLERDPRGRITAETSNGRTMALAYDALGRRSRRVTPSGAQSTWSYRTDRRSATLHLPGEELEFGYDAHGREVERRLGSTVVSQEWETGRQLASQTVTAGSGRVTCHREYSYLGSGRLGSVQDSRFGRREYSYDPHGRVSGVTGPGWSESYGFDQAGNLAHAVAPGADGYGVPPSGAGPAPDGEPRGAFSARGTLVRRAGRVRYGYDAEGRMVTRTHVLLSGGRRVWRYTWDAEDQLTAVQTPDGQRWSYTYDPLGRRIAKRLLAADGSAMEETTFTWDGTRLAEQTQHRATDPTERITTWEWAPHTHQAVSQQERTRLRDRAGTDVDARFFTVVTDGVGAPTELVDPAGDVVWQANATVWGGGAPLATAASCPLRFPGQYRDAETGLHYNYFRYYDPAIAAYCSPDPLGLAPAPNQHRYVPNPLVWTDPLGLSCDPLPPSDGAIQHAWDQHRWEGAYHQDAMLADAAARDSAALGLHDQAAEARNLRDNLMGNVLRQDMTRDEFAGHVRTAYQEGTQVTRSANDPREGQYVDHVFDDVEIGHNGQDGLRLAFNGDGNMNSAFPRWSWQ